MVSKFVIRGEKPNFLDITNDVVKAVESSKVTEGICVVTAASSSCAIATFDPAYENARRDVLNELNKALPPRIDYQGANSPYKAAALTKSALVQAAKAFPISCGKPQFGSGRNVYLVDFVGTENIEVNIKCL